MNLALTPIRFKRRAETEFGNKIGIVCGDVRLTYREYGRRANQLSNVLGRLGVRHGERVAWLGYNCHRLLEAYYGVVQMGAVLLPLNIRLTPSEIAFILNDSESVAVFYDLDFIPIVEAVRKDAVTIKKFIPLESASGESSSDGTDYQRLLPPPSPRSPPSGLSHPDPPQLY